MLPRYPNMVHCSLVGSFTDVPGADYVPTTFNLGRVSADEKLLRSILIGAESPYPEHSVYMSLLIRRAIRRSLFGKLLPVMGLFGGHKLEELERELFAAYTPVYSEGISVSSEALRVRLPQYTLRSISCEVDGTDVVLVDSKFGTITGTSTAPIALPGMPNGCFVRVASGNDIRTATWANRTRLSLGHIAADLSDRGRAVVATLSGVRGFLPSTSTNALKEAAIDHPVDAERVAAAALILTNVVYAKTHPV